jgi:hypothetical protein
MKVGSLSFGFGKPAFDSFSTDKQRWELSKDGETVTAVGCRTACC